ncbi:Molybdopterin or thiamine biosynthesis adenylyltransferase [Octadecabacter temperatus]|uniref:Molybdopterin-synthase adenylyltransferase n=1 Tax=Octadecabacter temperatus TaxID=1458307 RepID=A0A0K0Y2G4_9RHOB|nr:molybdopterin-synthase adenylyltransferase MoeB [Octadecabacter temperatus]AKS45091.1 putative adenylyltransferase/sulfurtransferase MoeZ [Octadecabacter temperatus]SIN86008.1 Molybdopterin or thiamine biosynthesis adenylyltransferase [Octadecabacter temperatus]
MAIVVGLAAALWGIGLAMNLSRFYRVSMIAALLLVLIALHLVLPDGHPIRESTGGEPELWIFIVAVGILLNGYSILLSFLRSRSAVKAEESPEPNDNEGPFSDTELTRYARHIVLREIGGAGQKALKDASVLVIGAGGLGAPALQYLAAAGVGTIGVIDDDVVDNSNLQRQVIHTDESIGMAKVQSAAKAMKALNPFVTVKPYERRLTDEIAIDLVSEYDLVLDGTDNFDTRYLVNETCVKAHKPLISAALTQWEGQISEYAPHAGTPCYQCIFPERPDPSLVPSCAEGGVLGPLPGVLGAMMAVEAVKTLTGAGEGLRGRLLIYDALYAETRIIGIKPRADCPICG